MNHPFGLPRPLSVCLFSLGLLLAGCGGSANGPIRPQPDWVASGQSQSFPTDRFLTGVGVGPSLDAARENARAEVARQFRVRIRSDLWRETQVTEQRSENGRTETVDNRSLIASLSTTEMEISGLTLAENWQDSQGQYHALAVLERAPAAAELLTAMARMDAAIIARRSSLAEVADAVAHAAEAQRAIDQFHERELMRQDLNVIDPIAAKASPPPVALAKLESRARSLNGQVDLAVSAAGEGAQPMRTYVEAVLRGRGFGVVSINRNPRYRMTAAVSGLVRSKRGAVHWEQGRLDLTLSDLSQGVVLAACNWLLKSGSGDPEFAHIKLTGEFKRQIDRSAADVILYFDDRPCRDRS